MAKITDPNDPRLDNKAGVPRSIMWSILQQEMSGDTEGREGKLITSGMHKGTRAQGPWQIMPLTGGDYGVKDYTQLRDFNFGREVAAKKLAHDFQVHGNWNDTVRAYTGKGLEADQYASEVMGRVGPLAGMAMQARPSTDIDPTSAAPDASAYRPALQPPRPPQYGDQFAPVLRYWGEQKDQATGQVNSAEAEYNKAVNSSPKDYASKASPMTSLGGVGLGSVFSGIASALSGNPEYLQNFNQSMRDQTATFHQEITDAQHQALASAYSTLQRARDRLDQAGNGIASAKVSQQMAEIADKARKYQNDSEQASLAAREASKAHWEALQAAGYVEDPNTHLPIKVSKGKSPVMQPKDFQEALHRFTSNPVLTNEKFPEMRHLAAAQVAAFLANTTMEGDTMDALTTRVDQAVPTLAAALGSDPVQLGKSLMKDAIMGQAIREIKGDPDAVSGATEYALAHQFINYKDLPEKIKASGAYDSFKPQGPEPSALQRGDYADAGGGGQRNVPASGASSEGQSSEGQNSYQMSLRPKPPSYAKMNAVQHLSTNIDYLEKLLEWHDNADQYGIHVALPDGQTREQIQKELRSLRKEEAANDARAQASRAEVR
jgi:hypothetical protein